MLALNLIVHHEGLVERLRPARTRGATSLLEAAASDAVLDEAYAWLCRRRRDAPFWHDVWHVRWRWAELKPRLQRELLDGTYRPEPTRTVSYGDGTAELWSSRDAVVWKAVSLVLGRYLPSRTPDGCTNWKGRGGLKAAVRAVREALPEKLPLVEIIRNASAAAAALKPPRPGILAALREPASASALTRCLGLPRQLLNHHIRELERVGP